VDVGEGWDNRLFRLGDHLAARFTPSSGLSGPEDETLVAYAAGRRWQLLVRRERAHLTIAWSHPHPTVRPSSGANTRNAQDAELRRA